jgi:protein YibB
MHAIITGELYGGWWLPQWDSHMRSHPEAKSVDYNIVVNSKPYFLFNASQLNPFRSEQFVWLDAGYGHGNRSIFPSDLVWQPVFPNGKVTVIKLTPKEDDIGRYELDDLYRKDRSVISGGFLAADFEAVQRFYRLFAKEVWRMLERRMIDDDQVRLKSLFGYFD